MEVAEIKKSDIIPLLKLWKKLSDFHMNFNDYVMPSSFWEVYMKNYFERDIGKANKITFIAKDNNLYIGFIKAEIRIAPEIFGGGKHGYISEIYIDEKYRGDGTALVLIEKVMNWIKEKNISSIRLNVNSQNIRAIKFYEKLGFFEVNKTLRLDM